MHYLFIDEFRVRLYPYDLQFAQGYRDKEHQSRIVYTRDISMGFSRMSKAGHGVTGLLGNFQLMIWFIFLFAREFYISTRQIFLTEETLLAV